MREILFRGKRIDNGEWVEGGFFREPYTDKAFIIRWNSFGLGFFEDIEVDPKTVGQYTSLTDENGKRIFEGDIVISKHPRRLSNKPFIVMYKPVVGGYGYWKLDIHEQLEVIGNIHDNPELIAEVEG